jgi:hypothetical protein
MSPEAKAALSEEYSNSLNFADGEIYRKIRDYQQRGMTFAERRWWAYLSKGKQKGLRRLLRRVRYKKAFDTLGDIEGLWPGSGFSFGNIEEILAMQCNKV